MHQKDAPMTISEFKFCNILMQYETRIDSRGAALPRASHGDTFSGEGRRGPQPYHPRARRQRR